MAGRDATTTSAPFAMVDRRRAAIDLAIVLAVFAIGSASLPVLAPLLRKGHGLGGALALASYQFTLEGLAPLTLIAIHRESFRDYGLRRERLAYSLVLAVVLAFLYDAALSLHAGAPLWIPLRRQPAVRMSLEAGFPGALAGIAITAAVWGALEGFFGVYFARKVSDVLIAPYRGWLSAGALGFAVFNGTIHVVVGQGLEGFLTSFASGYAIAVIPSVTGNAWGALLVQTLTNAAGHRS